jgi:hypothetical protein
MSVWHFLPLFTQRSHADFRLTLTDLEPWLQGYGRGPWRCANCPENSQTSRAPNFLGPNFLGPQIFGLSNFLGLQIFGTVGFLG